MADNQLDPYDYFMADEGDMSDFLDDADEEYYGVAAGNDTALDDYDGVSFFARHCFCSNYTVSYSCLGSSQMKYSK